MSDVLENMARRITEIAGNSVSASLMNRKRLEIDASKLSLAGNERARLEIVNEAFVKCVTTIYALDNGNPVNFRRQDGQILIPVCWGSSGWKAWGLREWEARVLKSVLQCRAHGHRPLLVYSSHSTRWHVNIEEYPTAESAATYMKNRPIQLAEWTTSVKKVRG